jgi:hypothetical protein
LSGGKEVGEPGPDEFGSFATKHPWLLGAIGAFWIGIWGYLILHDVRGAVAGAIVVGLIVALAWKQGSPLWRLRRALKRRHPRWFQ